MINAYFVLSHLANFKLIICHGCVLDQGCAVLFSYLVLVPCHFQEAWIFFNGVSVNFSCAILWSWLFFLGKYIHESWRFSTFFDAFYNYFLFLELLTCMCMCWSLIRIGGSGMDLRSKARVSIFPLFSHKKKRKKIQKSTNNFLIINFLCS